MKNLFNPLNFLSIFYIGVAFYALITAVHYFPQQKTIVDSNITNFFDWSLVQWQTWRPNKPIEQIKIGDLSIHGTINENFISTYNSTVATFNPKYTIIKDAILGPDGRIFKQNTSIPKEYRYISRKNISNDRTNLRKFENAIAMPTYDIYSEPFIYTTFMPMLYAVPLDILQNRRIFINRYISDIEVILERLGMPAHSPVYTQFGWTYAKNLVVFEPPSLDFIDVFLFKSFSETISRKNPQTQVSDKIYFYSDGFDPEGIKEKILESLQEVTSRIEIFKPPLKMEERIEAFRSFKTLISFDTDDLHLIPFMPEGSLIILIQPPDRLIKHVMIGRQTGHNIHVISSQEKDVAKIIIKTLTELKTL